MSQARDCQRWIDLYINETGNRDCRMEDVVQFAVERGLELPEPKDPIKILERRFSRAARQKTRQDPNTGRSYRAYHSYTAPDGQTTLWFDIDQSPPPPRDKMLASLNKRREQTVGDVWGMDCDAQRWNDVRPEGAEQIELEYDFNFDLELRKYELDDDAEAV